MSRHFYALQVIETMRERKTTFIVLDVENAKDGFFEQPARGGFDPRPARYVGKSSDGPDQSGPGLLLLARHS